MKLRHAKTVLLVLAGALAGAGAISYLRSPPSPAADTRPGAALSAAQRATPAPTATPVPERTRSGERRGGGQSDAGARLSAVVEAVRDGQVILIDVRARDPVMKLQQDGKLIVRLAPDAELVLRQQVTAKDLRQGDRVVIVGSIEGQTFVVRRLVIERTQ